VLKLPDWGGIDEIEEGEEGGKKKNRGRKGGGRKRERND
jgi:hypothetical protein